MAYVIDLSGGFYSGPHNSGSDLRRDGKYHSSYFGGMEVLYAGEIKIVNSRVEAINSEGGHYKPTIDNLVTAVEFLELSDVDIKTVLVLGVGMEEYADIIVIMGDDFLNRYRRLELNDRPGRFALVYGEEPTHRPFVFKKARNSDLSRGKTEFLPFVYFS